MTEYSIRLVARLDPLKYLFDEKTYEIACAFNRV